MRAYSIRKARPDDLADITRITREAYAIYVECLGREPKPMLRDYMSAIEAGDVFLLDVEDAPAGVLVLEREPDHILIYNVALAPTFQGPGFGKTLMDFAEIHTREFALPGNSALYQQKNDEEHRFLYLARICPDREATCRTPSGLNRGFHVQSDSVLDFSF